MAKAYRNSHYYAQGADGNGDITNAELDRLQTAGVRGIGFIHAYSAGAPNYSTLASNTVVTRAAARGIECYWVLKTGRDRNPGTGLFFSEWFNDAGWASEIATITTRAEEAADLGMAGMFWDDELFATENPDGLFGWTTNSMFPAGDPTDWLVRRGKVIQRGEEMGAALATAFPGMRLPAYWSHGHFPRMMQEFVYTFNGPGEILINDPAWKWGGGTNFAFHVGLLKTLAAGGCNYHFADHFFYWYRSTTNRYNSAWYLNNAWYSLWSKAIIDIYGQAAWAATAPYIHSAPFLFPGGDPNYVPWTSAEFRSMALSARDFAGGERFFTFDHSYFGNFDVHAAAFDSWIADYSAANVPAVSGDPMPTGSITTGALDVGGTITGYAAATRGVRRVYWTDGSTQLGARMIHENATTGLVANPTNVSLDDAALALRQQWTLTSVPANGWIIIEDVHGGTTQIGSPPATSGTPTVNTLAPRRPVWGLGDRERVAGPTQSKRVAS